MTEQVLDTGTRLQLLRLMMRSRLFEEKIVSVYGEQQMKTPVHLYIGQEAVAAGVCAHLKKEDYVFSTHRNHGHYLCKGADMKALFAELYGRAEGCSKGKGGSMHFVDTTCGCMGTSAIVGGSIPLGTGAALAAKTLGNGRISVSFFGDGAADEGVFQESMNFASLKKLPVVFICENNFYATNSHQDARQPSENIASRGKAYGIPSQRIDGNDVEKVYLAAKTATELARNGDGPSLIECVTYRWKGHVGPDCDYQKACRPKAELDLWMKKCPLKRYKTKLLRSGTATKDDFNKIEAELLEEINAAQAYGKNCAPPDPLSLTEDVYHIRKGN